MVIKKMLKRHKTEKDTDRFLKKSSPKPSFSEQDAVSKFLKSKKGQSLIKSNDRTAIKKALKKILRKHKKK